jgi:hypothetical protein
MISHEVKSARVESAQKALRSRLEIKVAGRSEVRRMSPAGFTFF